MNRPIAETPEQTAAWDATLTEHRAELDQLAHTVQADLGAVPAEADDDTW